MERKPVSIKAARKKIRAAQKKKQEVVTYPAPEGDDWKPDSWQRMWQMVYEKALAFMLDYVRAQQEQVA